MAKRAFDVGYRRLEWFCHKEDSRSILDAKTIGFKYEGVFRNYGIVKGTNYSVGCKFKKNKDLLIIILS